MYISSSSYPQVWQINWNIPDIVRADVSHVCSVGACHQDYTRDYTRDLTVSVYNRQALYPAIDEHTQLNRLYNLFDPIRSQIDAID